jgi:hypothetical protein
MPKFQKKYPNPSEIAVMQPEEVAQPELVEIAVVVPEEAPVIKVCGIGDCTTWYDDPAIMKKHYERQHGIGIKNLNRSLPRNADIKIS